MQNVYKRTPSNCINAWQIKKIKINEANVSQELKTTEYVLCYRLRHMIPQAKYLQDTTDLKERPKCRQSNLLV